MLLKGLYTALVTPFHENGDVNFDGFRQNIQNQLSENVNGIVVLGTTGESPTLSHEEKTALIKVAKDEIQNTSQLIVGTGSYSTAETIKATREAEELGADAVLIMTPYYNRPTQNGIYFHFEAVCNSTAIPICIYNHPGRTGQSITIDTLKRLADLPSIVGIKDCSGSINFMTDLFNELPSINPEFSILTGDDPLTYSLLALGGHGIISAVSNFIPGPMKALIEAGLKEDFIKARELHFQLQSLFKILFVETNPITIKAAMNFVNMAAGPCRLPLCQLEEKNHLELIEILKNIPQTWLGQYGQKKCASC